MTGTSRTTTSVVRSALWSAYGDALGFMTELADRSGVRRRTGQEEVTSLRPWVRRIGGRFGTDIRLPAGCYSDDTQLRLATARAIARDGTLDVEAFSKVELTVWRAYALGGGRGTKAAAEALAKPNTHWQSNFFESRGQRYLDSGGNGAAMRIQPHAWVACSSADPVEMLQQVVRNCITTHGHPTAIVGSCFHALCVHRAVRDARVPETKELQEFAAYLAELPRVIAADEALGALWKPVWERHAARSLADALLHSQRELREDLGKLERVMSRAGSAAAAIIYQEAVDALGATRAEWKGSASKTAVLAAFLSLVGQDASHEVLAVAANTLATDTDSIASMAGAIIGGAAAADPPEQVMDFEYISEQARCLSEGPASASRLAHPYPDLMQWSPPRTALDVVGSVSGGYGVAGLGLAVPKGDPIIDARQRRSQWCWLKLSIGQTMLVKMRTKLMSMPDQLLPRNRVAHRPTDRASLQEPSLFPGRSGSNPADSGTKALSLDEATDRVIASGFDPHLIGRLLLDLTASPLGVDGAVAFAAIVAKAKAARIKRSRQ